MKYFITGDIHGRLEKIDMFYREIIKDKSLKIENVCLIILGDCGFNYYLNKKDTLLKHAANEYGFKILNIKGNHEIHPDVLENYKLKEWNEGMVYVEDLYPNLLFAKDGEIYNINNKKTIVIGGAYSVDKEYRLLRGFKWFDTEQLSENDKKYVLQQLDKVNWNVDCVFSHAAPLKAEPRHLFLPFIDQSKVDKTTEIFLDKISDKLNFKDWYFGHYHSEYDNGKYHLLFNDIRDF